MADDYSNNTTTRGVLTVGGSVTGTLETAGDDDWFMITVTTGTYQFRLNQSSVSDPYLYLYSSSGALIAANDDGGGNLNTLISITLTAGTYFLSARGYNDNKTGAYSLSAVRTNSAPSLTGTPGTLANGTEDSSSLISSATLLEGFTDVDNDTLTVSSISVSGGSLSTSAGGLLYVTTADYIGTVTVIYNVSDGANLVSGVTQTFSLSAVNDAPRGMPTGTIVDGVEDTGQTILAPPLLQGLSDVENETLTVSAISADHGSFTAVEGGGSYAPEADGSGIVAVTYSVTDGTNTVSGLTRSFSLAAVNDAPRGTPNSIVDGGIEDETAFLPNALLLARLSDVEGESLTVTAMTSTHGSVIAVEGGWLFSPDSNFNGEYTVTYSVSDGTNTGTGLTSTLHMGAVNDAPIGAPTGTIANGVEDTQQTLLAATLLQGLFDTEGETLTVSAINVNHGTIIQTTGGWFYEPDADENGVVTVTYSVTDGTNTVSGLTRDFTVAAINDAPTGAPTGGIANGVEDTVQTILAADLLRGLFDTEGEPLTVPAIASNHGSLRQVAGGGAFTPESDNHDVVTLTYSVSDGPNTLSGLTRDFVLASVNDTAPVLTAAPSELTPGLSDHASPLSLADLTACFSDADNDVLSISDLVADHGTIVALTDGLYSLVPQAGYVGRVTLTILSTMELAA